MRKADIGAVIVSNKSGLRGIITDRDIVVRAVAEGKDPKSVKLEEICSREILALSPDNTVDQAVTIMRDKALRRLPVVEETTAVGIVSIGDLAGRLDRVDTRRATGGGTSQALHGSGQLSLDSPVEAQVQWSGPGL